MRAGHYFDASDVRVTAVLLPGAKSVAVVMIVDTPMTVASVVVSGVVPLRVIVRAFRSPRPAPAQTYTLPDALVGERIRPDGRADVVDTTLIKATPTVDVNANADARIAAKRARPRPAADHGVRRLHV